MSGGFGMTSTPPFTSKTWECQSLRSSAGSDSVVDYALADDAPSVMWAQ
ncbi:unnamed protein product [Tuber melanosporum]|uniref:(Perigord truffle) hypothetical protein n=1 Tax=Tuber melanosporum (strain Mel28) TaxID=656061 RepID=D5GJ45_TUBMM|nr:uncharacterized protein GSTUM_00008834001 [Tuber melanosporum]CAZ84538.1 unnamed protein product [Tuber melanosporum]